MLVTVAFGQAQPDVADILKKVAATYKAAKEYELVADVTPSAAGKGVASHVMIAFRAPNKYRMQGTGFGAVASGDEALMVYDGSVVWSYSLKSNEYGSIPASELIDSPGDLGDLKPEAVDYFALNGYREAADHIDGSKFLREETIEIAGAKVACYVLTINSGRNILTFWVDKERYRILRQDSADSSQLFTTVKINEPLPDELFTFTPPPGAKKIEPPQQ